MAWYDDLVSARYSGQSNQGSGDLNGGVPDTHLLSAQIGGLIHPDRINNYIQHLITQGMSYPDAIKKIQSVFGNYASQNNITPISPSSLPFQQLLNGNQNTGTGSGMQTSLSPANYNNPTVPANNTSKPYTMPMSVPDTNGWNTPLVNPATSIRKPVLQPLNNYYDDPTQIGFHEPWNDVRMGYADWMKTNPHNTYNDNPTSIVPPKPNLATTTHGTLSYVNPISYGGLNQNSGIAKLL